ncbi:Dps DNA-binding ferritin-like protein (oxidative damage protectant) [uncultured Caudovirales phage]|jgi:starvation-inducible DNA-binding protein|uniref:Dps DNA-binding ferritin-like protein (Oxidative damage protectant) n=1 Tax=uncultured Caudovirales phage TaxID=2100421 RepID=A0A6J5M1M5_9CAUD|nr:Dps DNA-binding ferritin-like protein (oxidative damage protectant) [uncultured Caudovirales phage]
MDELVQQMKVVLASTFAFYLKAHNFHWNVEGPNFPQYHSFLGDVYNEVWGAVDGIAEHIRTLDAYAPGSLSRFSQLSVVDDQLNIPNAKAMLAELASDNEKLIGELQKSFRLADAAGKDGVSNFLQDRIDAHTKHGWMLKATGK